MVKNKQSNGPGLSTFQPTVCGQKVINAKKYSDLPIMCKPTGAFTKQPALIVKTAHVSLTSKL